MTKRKGNTTYDYARIYHLYLLGTPKSTIALRMGCSKRTVDRAIARERSKGGSN